MACCAIVAFILSQCWLAVMTVRRWCFGATVRRAPGPGVGADWRREQEPRAVSTLPARGVRWKRWFDYTRCRAAVAFALSVGAVGVVYAVDHLAASSAAAASLGEFLGELCRSRP